MHTTEVLSSNDFEFYLHGKSSSIEEVLPNFNQKDRLGIVVSTLGGSIGASSLYMAAITRYYDYFRTKLGNEVDKLRIYPDYYIFHIGGRHMDHYWMDIWPSHKEIVIENNPQRVLDAINDRGITRLLVEQVPKVLWNYTRESYNSAFHRIDTTIAYSPYASVDDFTAQVIGPPIIEQYIKASLNRSSDLTDSMYSSFRSSSLVNGDGRVVESFRHLLLDEALSMLASPYS